MSSPAASAAGPASSVPGTRSLLLWHALAAALIFFASAARYEDPVWALETRFINAISLLTAGYLAGAVMSMVLLASSARVRSFNAALQAACLGLAGFALATLAFLLLEAPYSRGLLLVTVAAGLGFQVAPYLPLVPQRLATLALGAGAAAALTLNVFYALGLWPPPEVPKPGVRTDYLGSAYHDVAVRTFENQLPNPIDHQGGGLDVFRDSVLLATGDGDLYLIDPPGEQQGRRLKLRTLPYRVPMNAMRFREEAGMGIKLRGFRVNDVIIRERGEAFQLVASHHMWDSEEQCYVVRVSLLEGETRLLEDPEALEWRTLFDTSPCLSIGGNYSAAFVGYQVGGRLWFMADDQVLLALGDAGYDGWNTDQMYPQDDAASWGKVLLVSLEDGQVEPYSKGHRNPQGLYVSGAGEIWSTEHGPEGGDELNRLRPGANYGWPLATYGTEYNSFVWPLSDAPGRHEQFEEPVYTWTPSIGISNVVGIEAPLFSRWRGDLIVSSLVEETLYRVRVVDDRAVSVERLGAMPGRVRDLVEAPDGQLAAWTDSGLLVFLRPYDGDGNVDLVFTRCLECHKQEVGGDWLIAPNLRGVFGRPIAARDDYEYSVALKEVGGRWTEAQLDAFLAAPSTFAPGTAMRVAGVEDPEDRARLVEILRDYN